MNIVADHNKNIQDVLEILTDCAGNLTPELRKAAIYILENHYEIAVSSMRELSDLAGINPNSFVRLARTIGFDGYEDFREIFRQEIRKGNHNFTNRAQWLQTLAQKDNLGALYADMAESAIRNIENTFTTSCAADLQQAADSIMKARKIFVLGVGINYMLAHSFAYLADMALDNVHAIPRAGSIATDDIARICNQDVLIAMTFKPYRHEIIQAVQQARQHKVTLIGISDSLASPILLGAKHRFIVHSDTPQFFPSTVALTALLESLMAFIIADASPKIIANIEKFHAERHRLGIYHEPKDA